MNKKFDCVKMKHKIQKELYNKLKPKSVDDYFKKIIAYSKKSSLLMRPKLS
jgi:hypothetical protein